MILRYWKGYSYEEDIYLSLAQTEKKRCIQNTLLFNIKIAGTEDQSKILLKKTTYKIYL